MGVSGAFYEVPESFQGCPGVPGTQGDSVGLGSISGVLQRCSRRY